MRVTDVALRPWRDGADPEPPPGDRAVTMEVVADVLFGAGIRPRRRHRARADGGRERVHGEQPGGPPEGARVGADAAQRGDEPRGEEDRRAPLSDHREATRRRAARRSPGDAARRSGRRRHADERRAAPRRGHHALPRRPRDDRALLAHTLYLLSKHPDVERPPRRARVGARRAARRRPPTCRALPFAERVLKEAMRLYPPAWTTGREADRGGRDRRRTRSRRARVSPRHGSSTATLAGSRTPRASIPIAGRPSARRIFRASPTSRSAAARASASATTSR